MQEHSGTISGIFGHAGNTGEYRETQADIWEYRGIQENSGEYRGILENKRE
jgi:hypothetical protein